MRRLSRSFWKRLDGSLDVGASYTSASSLFKLDASGTLDWERPGYAVTLDASSTYTTQPDVDDTRRSNLSATYERRFENRWVALAQAQLEQNRELGFDLRSSLAAGGGRYFVQGRQDKLLAGLGLSVNREVPVEGDGTTNVEAIALLSYDRFAYDFPKVDVTVTLAGFASLNEGGRYRLELDAQFKRELVRDF
jgi:putative salt-induced outer membrane protein YdiY